MSVAHRAPLSRARPRSAHGQQQTKRVVARPLRFSSPMFKRSRGDAGGTILSGEFVRVSGATNALFFDGCLDWDAKNSFSVETISFANWSRFPIARNVNRVYHFFRIFTCAPTNDPFVGFRLAACTVRTFDKS